MMKRFQVVLRATGVSRSRRDTCMSRVMLHVLLALSLSATAATQTTQLNTQPANTPQTSPSTAPRQAPSTPPTASDRALSAAARSGDIATSRTLLAAGTNPDVRDSGGFTPLMLAAAGGHLDLVKLLVDRTDVNARSTGGFTSLMLAAFGGHQTVVDLLLQQGAHPSVKNNDGVVASDLARSAGNASVADALERIQQDVERFTGTWSMPADKRTDPQRTMFLDFHGVTVTFAPNGPTVSGLLTMRMSTKYADDRPPLSEEVVARVTIDVTTPQPLVTVAESRIVQNGKPQPGPVELRNLRWEGNELRADLHFGGKGRWGLWLNR